MPGKTHDFNNLRFYNPKPNARSMAIIGDVSSARTESVEAALRRYRSKQVPVYYTDAENSSQLFTDLSQRNYLVSDTVVVAENAAEYLHETDVPKLHRLLTKMEGQTHLIITGEKFTDSEIEKQFKRSMCAIFNVKITGSVAGRKHLLSFVKTEFDITPYQAEQLTTKMQFSMDNILQLARKAKAFTHLSYPELEDLAESSSDIAFTEALLRLRLADAMTLTENMTREGAEMALLSVLRAFKHIAIIHPVTRQVKTPGVAQAKQTRLPLGTIQRWWSVAGRYPPREQIRRNLLLVETSDRLNKEPSRTRNSFGAFERLVLGW